MATLKQRPDLPDADGALAGVLSERHFQEEERQSGKDEHDGVRDEEGSSAVAVAEVREPPDGAQTHSVRETRQDKLEIVAPVAALLLLLAGVGGFRARVDQLIILAVMNLDG